MSAPVRLADDTILKDPMAKDPTEKCIGCGAFVPRIEGPIHPYMTSAPGCWLIFGEVNARYFGNEAAASYRQLCADAFAVQHPGIATVRQAVQSVCVHLMSLYAQLELGIPSERMPIHNRPALEQRGERYHWLTPPSFENSLTVRSMLSSDKEPLEAAREWAQSAWSAWSEHHAQVRAWHDTIVRPAWR